MSLSRGWHLYGWGGGGWNPFMGAVCNMQHNRRHVFSIRTFFGTFRKLLARYQEWHSPFVVKAIRQDDHHIHERELQCQPFWQLALLQIFDTLGGRECKWGGHQSQYRAGSKWLKLAHTELSLDLNRPVLPTTALMLCKPGRKSWLANLPFWLSKLSQFIF